jgi:hypothetical protein
MHRPNTSGATRTAPDGVNMRESLNRIAGGLALAVMVAALVGVASPAAAQASAAAQTPAANAPFVIEYYYKAKWGHQAEFMALFKKNHLPILLKEKEKGRLLEVTLTEPRYHAAEDARWDFRVTLTFRNLAAAFGEGAITAAETKQLYPDTPTFEKEEQRRFEILDAHWDVPVTTGPFRLP